MTAMKDAGEILNCIEVLAENHPDNEQLDYLLTIFGRRPLPPEPPVNSAVTIGRNGNIWPIICRDEYGWDDPSAEWRQPQTWAELCRTTFEHTGRYPRPLVEQPTPTAGQASGTAPELPFRISRENGQTAISITAWPSVGAPRTGAVNVGGNYCELSPAELRGAAAAMVHIAAQAEETRS